MESMEINDAITAMFLIILVKYFVSGFFVCLRCAFTELSSFLWIILGCEAIVCTNMLASFCTLFSSLLFQFECMGSTKIILCIIWFKDRSWNIILKPSVINKKTSYIRAGDSWRLEDLDLDLLEWLLVEWLPPVTDIWFLLSSTRLISFSVIKHIVLAAWPTFPLLSNRNSSSLASGISGNSCPSFFSFSLCPKLELFFHWPDIVGKGPKPGGGAFYGFILYSSFQLQF